MLFRSARAAGLELRVDDPVEVELDRLGVERRAVVELDVATQLEGDAPAVPGALPRLGEPRYQLTVRRPIEQVLGEEGEQLDDRDAGVALARVIGPLGVNDPIRFFASWSSCSKSRSSRTGAVIGIAQPSNCSVRPRREEA